MRKKEKGQQRKDRTIDKQENPNEEKENNEKRINIYEIHTRKKLKRGNRYSIKLK